MGRKGARSERRLTVGELARRLDRAIERLTKAACRVAALRRSLKKAEARERAAGDRAERVTQGRVTEDVSHVVERARRLELE